MFLLLLLNDRGGNGIMKMYNIYISARNHNRWSSKLFIEPMKHFRLELHQ